MFLGSLKRIFVNVVDLIHRSRRIQVSTKTEFSLNNFAFEQMNRKFLLIIQTVQNEFQMEGLIQKNIPQYKGAYQD